MAFKVSNKSILDWLTVNVEAFFFFFYCLKDSSLTKDGCTWFQGDILNGMVVVMILRNMY